MAIGQYEDMGPSPERRDEVYRVDVEFSHPGGYYDEPIIVSLSTPGGRIHYTLDGSTPTRRSKKYDGPIEVNKTTVVRAAAYSGSRKSKMEGRTFFINEPASTFPTISLAVTPEILFSQETGLYVKGPNAIDSLWRKDGANFWSKKEIRCHVEFFEDDGKCEFNSGAGMRLFGGVSRLFEQKSMSIVTRDRYGKKRIKHRVFGKNGEKNFKFLVLRNSGSDWGKTHFRDALITNLVDDWDLEKQDYRPSHVYLNGEYWGIYNIREKINRYFLASHADVDPDSLDLLEHKYVVKCGGRQHYLKMLRYIGKNNMAEDKHFEYIKTQMDVENFMDYQIAQIYIDNRDAGGNIKFWRPQIANGKWRWILYDTDWGFGLHYPKGYSTNSLEFFTAADGPDWPNPPWSTFILRNLLKNKVFNEAFERRFMDRINTSFSAEYVLRKIEKFEAKYEPEIDRHHERWEIPNWHRDMHIDIMKEYVEKRPSYMIGFIQKYFNSGELTDVKILPGEGGKVVFNELLPVKKKPFTGTYFQGQTLNLKAIPKFGYRFSHWVGKNGTEAINNESLEMDIVLNGGNFYLRPVFEPYTHPLAGQIIINEISPRDRDAGDWVELFNNSDSTIDMTGWLFTDNKNTFRFSQIELAPKSHLVLCEDQIAFAHAYPGVTNMIGNLGFGLNKRGEQLALFDELGASVDSVNYKVDPLDTVFTVSLIMPNLDNGDAENWTVEFGTGTPESMNPKFLESSIRTAQGLWVRIGVGLSIFLCLFFLLLIRKRIG